MAREETALAVADPPGTYLRGEWERAGSDQEVEKGQPPARDRDREDDAELGSGLIKPTI